MALTWKWNESIGEVKTNYLKEGWTLRLYHGNALLISINETEKQYQMGLFLCDKEHLDRCIKDFNPFEGWLEVSLNKNFKLNATTAKLLDALRSKGVKITLEGDNQQ